MSDDWREYQEEAANFFRGLGLKAETDVRVEGVRTAHDVDVVVKSVYAGFDVTWFIECKNWKSPVSKLHVLGLRQIVIDCGADRGILLSESGFQSGAIEAANLTNIQLSSLADLEENSMHEVFAMRLRELFDRLEICSQNYWDIPKGVRIKAGLRPDFGDDKGYSGQQVIDYCRDVVSHSMRGRYPVVIDSIATHVYPYLKRELHSAAEAVSVLTDLISDLERRLSSVRGA